MSAAQPAGDLLQPVPLQELLPPVQVQVLLLLLV